MRLWLALALAATPAAAQTLNLNDYPTATRAEYVFACMKTNGETRDSLDRCSCSIDVIASLIPYDAYVAGETVAAITQDGGPIGRSFKASTLIKDDLAKLRRAQAEAEVRCF